MNLAEFSSRPLSAVRYERETPCELCDGSSFQLVSRLDRSGKPLDTVVCTDCGLVMHGVLPTPDELESFYAWEYREAYHGEQAPSAKRVWKAWREASITARRLAQRAPAGSSVLDVGAGLGCLVRQLGDLGYDACGIEPGRAFQRFAQETLGANVVLGDWQSARFADRFDVIVMLHVIEHFRSPRRALLQARGMLAEGGKLLLTCPNLAGAFASRKRLFHTAHIHNFTTSTLEALANSSGFQLLESLAPHDGENILLWLERSQPMEPTDKRAMYEETCAALQNCSTWRYYTRPRYIKRCLVRASRVVGERWGARMFMAKMHRMARKNVSAP